MPHGKHWQQSFLTLAVVAALAVIALAGHHFEWKVPKFSDLTGTRAKTDRDWCDEHGISEAICVECDDARYPRPPHPGWCRTHGVPDCPFENPSVAQLVNAPAVAAYDLERAERALSLKLRPENSDKCKLHHKRIQFATKDAMDRMGVDVRQAVRKPIIESITASGEILFDPSRVAPQHVPVSGRVWAVTEKGKLGALVKQGDVLAIIEAAEVGKAKVDLVQALVQQQLNGKLHDTMKKLAGDSLPLIEFQKAEAALRSSELAVAQSLQALSTMGLFVQPDQWKGLSVAEMSQRLHFFGLPYEIVQRIDQRSTSSNLLALRASRDGAIIAAKVVAGETVDPNKALFTVADTSQMWLTLNVRSEDLKLLRVRNSSTGQPGQSVRFRPDGADQDVVGTISWISPMVDDRTRTLQARADVPNPDGILRANTFGSGQIVLREETQAIVVPNEAVHWEGHCHVVFVRDKRFFDADAPKLFHVRTVRLGVRDSEKTEILAGLLPGEVVATANSSIMRAQLLRSNLGAG